MLDAFRNFVAELTGGDKSPEEFGEGDYRLAAAALLLHAASIDGEPGAAERDMLHSLLIRRFELDDAATGRLIDAATVAEQEAIDLYHFTSLLNRTLDEEGRLRLIEMMWQIAYADGRVTEFEDNLIWRAADLLGISSQDRIALRQRVAGAASSS